MPVYYNQKTQRWVFYPGDPYRSFGGDHPPPGTTAPVTQTLTAPQVPGSVHGPLGGTPWSPYSQWREDPTSWTPQWHEQTEAEMERAFRFNRWLRRLLTIWVGYWFGQLGNAFLTGQGLSTLTRTILGALAASQIDDPHFSFGFSTGWFLGNPRDVWRTVEAGAAALETVGEVAEVAGEIVAGATDITVSVGQSVWRYWTEPLIRIIVRVTTGWPPVLYGGPITNPFAP